MAASCAYVNDASGSTKCGEFLDRITDCCLRRKDFAPWSYLVS